MILLLIGSYIPNVFWLETVNTRQNGYQTVPFSVYIHNLIFVFILECSENSLGMDVILPLIGS